MPQFLDVAVAPLLLTNGSSSLCLCLVDAFAGLHVHGAQPDVLAAVVHDPSGTRRDVVQDRLADCGLLSLCHVKDRDRAIPEETEPGGRAETEQPSNNPHENWIGVHVTVALQL
jgi:hypothetical protein